MNTSLQTLPLESEDVRDLLDLLTAGLATFFHFSRADLYFPARGALPEPEYIAEEKVLLLPLPWRGRLLGALRLADVRLREARPLLARLPAVTALCLETLAREKAGATDPSTGLFTERELYGRIARSAERVHAILARSPACGDLEATSCLRHLCMGIVVVRLFSARAIAEMGGHDYLERCLARLAAALKEGLEPDVVAARAGRADFAILLPGVSGRGACARVAEGALARMGAVDLDERHVPGHAPAHLAAGYAIFPQDMHPAELRFTPVGQGRELLERARMTAGVAAQRGPGTSMPFVRVLRDGGVVLRPLGMGRLLVNLGRRAQARDGLRFALIDQATGRPKGEVVLLHVRATDAVAEISHLADPGVLPEAGDTLSLLDNSPAFGAATDLGHEERALDGAAPVAGEGGHAAEEDGATPAPDTPPCLGHGAFMDRYATITGGRAPFTLALLRLGGGEESGGGSLADAADRASGQDSDQDAGPDAASLREAASLWAETCAAPGAFAGFYGVNGLIFCHPGADAEAAAALEERYRALWTSLDSRGLDVAIGISPWPLLTYGRGEVLECALRALEYAMLLPAPRVGSCNSAAITIGADRRYSQGDVFGAVEEYKLALLADEGNALAWNSLGVCMAALGRAEEARRHFERSREVGGSAQERAQASYNLGTVCQQLGDEAQAAACYADCVAADPDHAFALVRLGQLAEKGGHPEAALAWYEKAARAEARAAGESDARDGGTFGEGGFDAGVALTLRCLARMAVGKSRDGEARELLSEALRRDPDDVGAMLMLASLYLEEPGAADIAELLARHCLTIAPLPAAWETLARALDAQGRPEAAAAARLRAGRG